MRLTLRGNEISRCSSQPGETLSNCYEAGKSMAARNPQIRFRIANSDDAARIHDCLFNAFEPVRTQYTPGAFANTVPSIPELQKRISDMQLFVAECDGRVIGTVGCYKTND